MAVVREKEIGTLEQISVTPIRPWQLILGKLRPFALIGMLDMLLVTAAVTVSSSASLSAAPSCCWSA